LIRPDGSDNAGKAVADRLRLKIELSEALIRSPARMPGFALPSGTMVETKKATFS